MFDFEYLLDRYEELINIRKQLMIHPNDRDRSINKEIWEVETFYKNIIISIDNPVIREYNSNS